METNAWPLIAGLVVGVLFAALPCRKLSARTLLLVVVHRAGLTG